MSSVPFPGPVRYRRRVANTNVEQAAVWNGAAGEHRVRYAETDDPGLKARFRAATAVRSHDHVLDIGCGTGGSTRDAARAATSGSALGVDLSSLMLERARELSVGERLYNVSYERADAQVFHFPPRRFDLAISRFGSMFFSDPVAAFTNISRALRPGGRLVLLVWQSIERNEWATVIREALASAKETAVSLSAFSLADPAEVELILTEAGFRDVAFDEVHEPVHYGADAESAYGFIRGLRSTSDLLASLDATEPALERLRAAVAEHDTGSGVRFDSRTWIVTAHASGGRMTGDRR
jgi:ubiquinone/menaquinone biosynthesis C-methylase UbiE